MIQFIKYSLLFLLFSNIVLAKSINFTQEEQNWLKNNPVIKIAVMDYWNQDSTGNSTSTNYIKLLNQYSDLNIQPIKFNNWKNGYDAALNNNNDILGITNLSWSKEREKKFIYTNSYNFEPYYLIVRESDSQISNLKKLKEKTVLYKEKSITYYILKDISKSIDMVPMASHIQMYQQLFENKKIDAFITYYKNNKLLEKYSLEVAETIYNKYSEVSIGINKNLKYLQSIINKIHQNIPKNELVDLRYKIYSQPQLYKDKYSNTKNQITLTIDQKNYLKEKKQITMCIDPNWMPFEKFDKNSKHIGMSADYYKLFEKILEKKFEVIRTDSWSQSLEFAKQRKCDILSLAMETSKRKKYMNFTKPYIQVPVVLATKLDTTFIDNIRFLKNKKIGIVKNGAFSELLRDEYPNLNIVDIDTIYQGLTMVEKGELYGFADTSIAIGTIIQTDFTGVLKISARFNEKMNLSIGVRKDDIILLNLLQKAIDNIKQDQKIKILNKWISIKYEKEIDYTLIWQIIIIVSIASLLIIYRQLLLKNQNKKLEILVNEKTKNLNDLNKNLEDTIKLRTNELSDNFKFVQSLLDSVVFGVVQSDMNGKCIDVNKSTVDMMLYKNKNEFIGKNIFEVIADNSKEIVKYNILNNYNEPYEINLINGKNEEFPVLMKDKNIVYNDQTIRLSTFVDISDLKKKDKLLFEQSKLASMGEMIGNIAHQWRQPLSIISTASTGMKMQYELNSLNSEEIPEMCDAINNNAQYLSKTIDDFQDFIKGERIKEIFNLSDNINSFLHLVEGTIKNNNINIILDLEENIKIDGYENELIQCLINIFNNAKDVLKNIEENKYNFISTNIIDGKVVIKIRDNAGGIPQDILPKIYEPYFTTKHKSQGTGLGLHMTYNLIVDGMGGTIEANNVEFEYDGKDYTGAEFTITLPLN